VALVRQASSPNSCGISANCRALRGDWARQSADYHRNGYSKKTVLTENAALQVLIPRDRHGSFEPQLIAKYQRRFPGFDEKIVSMDSRGISVRDGKPIGASPRL
jgi:transposase-like protein